MFDIHVGFVPWLYLLMMISNCTAKRAQLSQSQYLNVVLSLDEFRIDLGFLYSVTKANSTLLFCCGVPGNVNPNLMLKLES
jgi:hypothetical protein